MLTDAEIAKLVTNKRYRGITKVGAKEFASDILRLDGVEFKPEVAQLTRITTYFFRHRIARGEVYHCASRLLERMLNGGLSFPRNPDSIRMICEDNAANSYWMRYDARQVQALFGLARRLLTDGTYRGIIKEHSSRNETEGNLRLGEIGEELRLLEEMTLNAIKARKLFDQHLEYNADVFYKKNEIEIQRQFLRGISLTSRQPHVEGGLPWALIDKHGDDNVGTKSG